MIDLDFESVLDGEYIKVLFRNYKYESLRHDDDQTELTDFQTGELEQRILNAEDFLLMILREQK
jgi:hypothetical protein